MRFVAQATRRRAMAISFRTGDLLPAERCAPGALFAADRDETEWERWRSRRREDPLDRGFPAVPPRAGDEEAESGFLARFGRAREDGWAVDDRLIEPGLLAVALPVRDAAGAVVCAVSAVGHTSRHDTAPLLAPALPPLRTAPCCTTGRRAVSTMRLAGAPAPWPGL
ncbi:IclR family transcriptional regulator domain-containing protein [Streptomyces sp. NPDC055663]